MRQVVTQLRVSCFGSADYFDHTGLVTCYLLFVMKVATRTVHFAGCTTNPNEAWMPQIARNLTDCCDGFLQGIRYLLITATQAHPLE